MRKEGVFIIVAVLLLLFLSSNYYYIFNAAALFILAGGIAGTPFSFPGSFMLFCILTALATILAWPFRDSINEKLQLNKKLLKPLLARRRQVR